jgi:PAS domain S-box-containing protein
MNDAQKGRGKPIKERKEAREEISALRMSATEHKWAKKELRRYRGSLGSAVKEQTGGLARASSQRRGKIAERTGVGEELLESEKLFRGVFERATEGILLTDIRTKKFVYGNYAISRMLGYNLDEIRTLGVTDIHPKENLPHIHARFEKLIRGEIICAEGVQVQRKDGSIFYADIFPYQTKVGARTYVISIFTDVTERKRVEEELRNSEARFRAIFDKTSDGIFLVDLRARKFSICNATCATMLDYTQEEFLNLDIADIHPGEDLPFIYEEIRKFSRGEKGVRGDIRFKRKDGSIFVADLSPALVTIAGKENLVISFKDITERKRGEEALRESGERLREAQALGRIGNWEFDIDNQKITWSDQVYRLYERDPALGPPTVEEEAAYYAPEQLERLHEYVRRAVEEGKEFRYDLQVHLPSGRLAHFSATMRPVKDESGRVIRLFGTVQDITERKRVEESLWEKERAIESSINGIAIADLDGKLTYANAAALKMWGYANEEEAVGKSGTDFWNAPEKVKEIIEALQGQKGWIGELTAKRKDGSTFEVQMSASRVVDKTGKPISLLAAFVDITERKRAEDNYRSIFENAVVGIYQSTPQGQFLAANPAFARIFGYDSPRQVAEIAGGAAQKLYVDKCKRRAFEQLMELHGEVHDLEFEGYHRDGRKMWIKENARAVRDDKGHVAYYEGFVEDITIQKEAEQELQQVARHVIEAQEAERKRIACDLHDGVSQLLSSAKFRLASVGEEIFKETLKSHHELDDSRTLVEKAIQEIRRIIRNLRPVVLDDLGLLPAVRSLCEEFRGKTNMKLDFKSTPKPTRLAPKVELALFRIVQEALNNVEKHSRATRVSVSFLQKQASLQIKVKDNGVGFNYLAALRNKGNLSGYGLHTMIDRTASVGGEVGIRSVIDKGTEVIVHIPLNGSGRCD